MYAAGDGTKQMLELRALVDDTTMPGEGNLNLRIVHAAPFAADMDATAVSIRTDDGTVVCTDDGTDEIATRRSSQDPRVRWYANWG